MRPLTCLALLLTLFLCAPSPAATPPHHTVVS
jgi:hypothetical protein